MSTTNSHIEPVQGLSQGTRSLVSLLIFIHLFCVAVSLLGNESSSVLRNRLFGVLAPYTISLNIDPEFTAGFHLTHAMEYEDDHQLVITLDDIDTPRLHPGTATVVSRIPFDFRRQRWQMLARRLGILASEENDEAIAELVRSIGESIFAETDIRQIVVQCRRVRPSELDSDINRSLDDESTYETLYSADVLLDSKGVVRIHKQIQADEAAPLRKI